MWKHFPAFTDRFSLCVTWCPDRALALLLAVTSADGMCVARAAVRSAADPSYVADVAAQMYARARQKAPVAVVLLHPAGSDHRPWLRALTLRLGASADLVAVEAAEDEGVQAGTWGGAAQGAAGGAGVMLRHAQDAITQLAKECRMESVGSE
ncbi:hypothetical protein ACFU0X_10130 [Streptomyces cellulosae]|uniref:Uncharacterized protein n=1 Tax=Streptomyces cellulosae TaxID=1968 RepID=A0ABW6JGC1_STRCE